MSKKISSGLIAFTFAAALMLAGSAEAGPLATDTAGPEASPWSMAWAWLTEFWGDLTGLHAATESVELDGTCSGECSSSGYGIDPNGSGSGG